MEFLTGLLENSSIPWITALVLGLMTAISPCPLVTNITAVGFISKDIENRNRVFVNGLFYTLGRAVSYTSLALIIFLGADHLKFSGILQQHGEKILAPFLILIGLLMLDIVRINFPGLGRISEKMEKKVKWGYWDALLLGCIFALAFCPYSGVLYFGILIPMSIGSASGLYLPFVFALATGIPVILLSWMIAYTLNGIGVVYLRIKTFELWFRRIIAVGFILAGIYFLFRTYF